MSRIRTSLVSAGLTILVLIGVGSWAFHKFEGWTWAESFYFSVATLTTVGYGDIHPTSGGSRVFAAFYILFGVGIMITALTRVGSEYLSRQERRLSDNISRRVDRNEKKNNDKK